MEYTKKTSDELLIAGCSKGDRVAQRSLYEKYYSTMFSLCARYTCNEDDTMQILNDGFLKVFNKVALYEFTGSFEGWIKRIMFRTALDFIRQNKSYKANIALSDNQIDYDGEVYNNVLNSMHGEMINKIIQKISPASRTVFSMFLIDGYSHKEIAQTLQISENTSKWHLCNAKNQFIAIAQPHLAELFA